MVTFLAVMLRNRRHSLASALITKIFCKRTKESTFDYPEECLFGKLHSFSICCCSKHDARLCVYNKCFILFTVKAVFKEILLIMLWWKTVQKKSDFSIQQRV